MTDHGGRTRNATKDETRQAILDVARGLFARFGPIKTTVADIAREIGMSPANIYNFYASRDAILEAAATFHLGLLRRQIEREISQTSDYWSQVEILFLSTLNHLRDNLENEKNILHLQALERKNDWKFVTEFHRFLIEALARILATGVQAGRFRVADPEAAASAIFDCMIGAIDPLIIMKVERVEHLERTRAQLALLERALS